MVESQIESTKYSFNLSTMITVIFPSLNEEKTIGQVVRLAKNSPDVTEVIVVDNKRTSLQVRHRQDKQ